MIIGYARVSTDDQSTAAQLPELEKAGCEFVYRENLSGRNLERPELDKCLDRLRKGDTLVVWRLDRLGRSIRDLLNIIDRLNAAKVNFISLKEKFDTSTASGRLVFHFFAALTEFERELIRERTLLGLSAARARGRVGGRKKKLSSQQIRVVKTMWDSKDYTKQEIGTQFGVSVSTIDRIIRPVPNWKGSKIPNEKSTPVKTKAATKAKKAGK
jgi:DNA invertase Pin-like site-specific DNA recombinase